MLIEKLEDWNRRPADLASIDLLKKVLLGDPEYFRIEHAINNHMVGADGSLNSVDTQLAQKEWNGLKAAYEKVGIETAVLPSNPELPDSCFTANPSMVIPLPLGGKEVWLAKMAHPSRQREVPLHKEFFQKLGFPLRTMPKEVTRFEGCGDGILHPGRFCLHAGVGTRTSRKAWETIADAYPEMDILLYELIHPDFYHLDTALAPLNEDVAFFVPEAFHPDGIQFIEAAFPRAIALNREESMRFAGNAHCPDQKHVFMESGCPLAASKLPALGMEAVTLETGEFRKSGGSVFCLKQSF